LAQGNERGFHPSAAWRTNGFNDSTWLTGTAPFHYGTSGATGDDSITTGTILTDMWNSYRGIFLRRTFVITNVGEILSVSLTATCDDGFVAWINGVEVARTNINGQPTYLTNATTSVEPCRTNTFIVNVTPTNYLSAGSNVLTVQAFNQSITGSDFRFDTTLQITKPDFTPPTISSVTPAAGASIGSLSQVTIVFSEAVVGVGAADLLVNGIPATGLVGNAGTNRYTFLFTQPANGSVNLTWNGSHGITDLAGFPFDAAAPAATWSYTLVPPAVANVVPAPGSALQALTQITVTFNTPVVGVEVGDLLVNSLPATSLSGSGSVWTFFFTQPPPGPVQVNFDVNHTITDVDGDRFIETAPSASWQYSLADTIPPVVSFALPAPGATVGALTRIEVTFKETVAGVDAADLRINGQPASQVTGALAGPYTFEFPQPAAGTVAITWGTGHEIRDTSPAANLLAGAGWSYVLNSNAAFGNVVINEFLADNLTGLLDEDGQKQDWIELWNRGANNVNLLGWSLTDDPDDPGRWSFPAVTLNAGQYLVVFASAKDRKPTAPGGKLHSNFRLNSAGNYLGLFNSQLPRQAVSEFSPAYPEQRGDVSYGFTAADTPSYFTTPTPGAANSPASALSGVVPPPAASVKSGFFNQSFNVVLSTATSGAEIRYTLDGSVPTPGSALYTDALTISATPDRAVVLLRAAAFKPGWLSSEITTHSYIFPDYVITQPANPAGFPAIWDSPCSAGINCSDIPGDYEMDPQIVNSGNNAALIRAGLVSLPTLSIVTDPDRLFGPPKVSMCAGRTGTNSR
jgi:hypothetical protein